MAVQLMITLRSTAIVKQIPFTVEPLKMVSHSKVNISVMIKISHVKILQKNCLLVSLKVMNVS
jgi:hypothetical protein